MASAPSTPHHVVGGAFLIREMSKALVSRVAHFAASYSGHVLTKFEFLAFSQLRLLPQR
jgi:hypothetical protein